MAHRVRFKLFIPADRILSYYQGIAKSVSVVSYEGQRIEFPAERLRPFLSHDGVMGEFELEYDGNNRFVALYKLRNLK